MYVHEDIYLWIEEVKEAFWLVKTLLRDKKLPLSYRILTSLTEMIRALYPPIDWMLLILDEKRLERINK